MRNWEVVTALVVVVQAGDFSMHMMTPSIYLRNECKKMPSIFEPEQYHSLGRIQRRSLIRKLLKLL